MKWEVLQMNEKCANGFNVNTIRKIETVIPEGWHLVAQTRTKREAEEIFKAEGGCFFR